MPIIILNPWLPRNVEVKLKFNSLSMESESENGIFLFILLPQWQLRGLINEFNFALNWC